MAGVGGVPRSDESPDYEYIPGLVRFRRNGRVETMEQDATHGAPDDSISYSVAVFTFLGTLVHNQSGSDKLTWGNKYALSRTNIYATMQALADGGYTLVIIDNYADDLYSFVVDFLKGTNTRPFVYLIREYPRYWLPDVKIWFAFLRDAGLYQLLSHRDNINPIVPVPTTEDNVQARDVAPELSSYFADDSFFCSNTFEDDRDILFAQNIALPLRPVDQLFGPYEEPQLELRNSRVIFMLAASPCQFSKWFKRIQNLNRITIQYDDDGGNINYRYVDASGESVSHGDLREQLRLVIRDNYTPIIWIRNPTQAGRSQLISEIRSIIDTAGQSGEGTRVVHGHILWFTKPIRNSSNGNNDVLSAYIDNFETPLDATRMN